MNMVMKFGLGSVVTSSETANFPSDPLHRVFSLSANSFC